MHTPPRLVVRYGLITVCAVSLSCAVGCGADTKRLQQQIAGLQKSLTSCQTDRNNYQTAANEMKKKLAEALAAAAAAQKAAAQAPGGADSSVGEVVIKNPKHTGSRRSPYAGTPTLKRQDILAAVSSSRRTLQPCYQRLIKRNTAFHHRKLSITVRMSVHPSGSPKRITVTPRYDATLSACLVKAIKRWRFPAFSGGFAEIEVPLMLRPKR